MAADKQPNYVFASGLATGINVIPLTSLITVKDTGELFTLNEKTGLTSSSTVNDAMALPANEPFGKALVGPEGPQGVQGPQGVKGDTGSTGQTGAVGATGAQGETGANGSGVAIQGNDTIVNIRGKAIVAGHMWISIDSGVDDLGNAVAAGDGIVAAVTDWVTVGPIRGPQGQQGIQGVQGEPGVAGNDGAVGPEGPEGPQGEVGPQGSTGTTGAQGDKGDPGYSAYEVAVNEGYIGTEAEWLLTLVGEDGPQGIQGEDGAIGPKGDDGDDGPAGADGLQGPKGETGDQGPAGADATVEFASQVETDAGALSDKVISPATLAGSIYAADQLHTVQLKDTIPDAADLNNYKETGMFHQDSSAFAGNGSNYPNSVAGMLIVVGNDDGEYVYQEYRTYNAPYTIFNRTYYDSSSTWGPWATSYTSENSNFAPIANPNFTGTPKVSGNNIWHAGNDGPGSGLDADTLDGVHGDSFLQRSGGIMTGLLISNQYSIMAFNSALYKCDIGWVNGYINYRYGTDGNALGIRLANYDTTTMTLGRNGRLTCLTLTLESIPTTTQAANMHHSTSSAYAVFRYSSLRAGKDNIKTIENGLEAALKLRPVNFTPNPEVHPDDHPRVQVGLIAEEVEEAGVDLATYGEDEKLEAVAYERVGVMAIAAIQELNDTIEKLKARIEVLEG